MKNQPILTFNSQVLCDFVHFFCLWVVFQKPKLVWSQIMTPFSNLSPCGMIGTFVANGFSRSNHSSVSTFFVGFRPDNKNAAGMIPGRSNYLLYFVSQVPIFGWIALNGGPQNHPKLAVLRCRKTNGVRIFRAPTCFEQSSLKRCVLPVANPSRCQAFLAGVTAFEIEFEAAGKRFGWSKPWQRSAPFPRSQTILSQCLLQPKTK